MDSCITIMVLCGKYCDGYYMAMRGNCCTNYWIDKIQKREERQVNSGLSIRVVENNELKFSLLMFFIHGASVVAY